MGFKLDKKDCENVIRGNLDHVLEQRLSVLGAELMNATQTEKVYRIQGQMLMLIEVSELRSKATGQLQRQ